MHIEVQVALNFVISYLYNKLPRRRVNLFGEELEKALKDKFQGHWYPEKPFKGSAFRCLKTGDPIDDALIRAARESGVPISDILENLPAELSVWVDPGEVSYRIGEKGAVKILFSEHHDHSEDSSSADREVTKTFNPEAQCFRPIDAVSNSLNGLSLSPKNSSQDASPTSSTSPTFKNGSSPNVAANTFLPRTQAPITFTTATFAQTKFGSTKLKTSSKRTNSSYRMSPTEFSNYIKQRAMQQQIHHSHNGPQQQHYGQAATSPSRSISPSLGLGGFQNDSFYFPNNMNSGINGYHQFGNGHSPNGSNTNNGIIGHHRNSMFETTQFSQQQHDNTLNGGLYNGIGQSKFSSFMEPQNFYGMNNHSQQQQQQQIQSSITNSGTGNINNNTSSSNSNNNNSNQTNNSIIGGSSNNTNCTTNSTATTSSAIAAGSGNQQQQQDTSKLIDGLQSFYSSTGPYQHLLVAN